MKKNFIAFCVAVVMLASTVAAPMAHAGSTGRRNTAIALGAGTVYAAVKGKKKVAIVGAVGTAYAYKRYKNQKRREQASKNRRYKKRYWCKRHNKYHPYKHRRR